MLLRYSDISILLLTCVKHYESHATFPWIFMEVDLCIIPFKRPKSFLLFVVCIWILYEILCVFLCTIFILCACTWKYYSTLLSRTVCRMYSTYIGLFLLAGIHCWDKCGFTYVSSVTLDEMWFNPGCGD